MLYHELRVLVPAETTTFAEGSGAGFRVMSGTEACEIVHDAVTKPIAVRVNDETAPIIVVWERTVPVAASGAL